MLTLAYLPFIFFVVIVSLEMVWPRNTDTRIDMRRWLSNAALYVMNRAGSRGIYFLLFAGGMQLSQTNSAAADGFLQAAGITLATLVLFDGLDYVKHVLLHRVPLLWRIHKVHHSDKKLDFSSEFRFHPFEMVLSISLDLSLIILLDIPLYAITLIAIASMVWGLIVHSNTQSFDFIDRFARVVLVTPNLHHIHHYTEVAAANKNFGGIFSIWDRIFGSYLSPDNLATGKHEYGVIEINERESLSPIKLLMLPFEATNSRADIGSDKIAKPSDR